MSIEQKLQYMADSGEGKLYYYYYTVRQSQLHWCSHFLFLYLHKYYVHVVSIGRSEGPLFDM